MVFYAAGLRARSARLVRGSSRQMTTMRVALARAGEQQIRRGRQDAAGGDVRHPELPLLLSGDGVQRDHGAMPARNIGQEL